MSRDAAGGGRTVLVVDDDERLRSRLVRALADRGFEARAAAGAREAMASAASDPPELAVVDLRMPDGSGLDLVRDLRALDPGTQVVVLTGFGSIATAVEAMRLGAVHYLTKPADADDVVAAFARAEGAAPEAPPTGPIPSLARAEWEHIHRVLAECDGNISQAARALGIHRRSLQRKLAKYPARR